MTKTPIRLQYFFLFILIPGFIIILSLRFSPYLFKNVGAILLNQSLANNDGVTDYRLLEQSERWLQVAKRVSSNELFGWRLLGSALLVADQAEEAEALWKAAGASPASLYVIGGNREQSAGHINEAIQSYEKAVQNDATLIEVWFLIGTLASENRQMDLAVSAFQEGWSLGDVESGNQLARIHFDNGDFQAAAEIWQDALNRIPDISRRLIWWRWLALSYRASEQWEKGLLVASDALAEFPEDPQLLLELGYAHFNVNGSIDKAIEAFNQAMTLDVENPSPYAAMAWLAAEENRYKEAVEWYDEAIARDSANRSWHLARAHMARASGDLTLALDLFLETINNFPNFAPAYYGMVLVYRELDEPEKAIQAVERALLLTSKPPPEYYNRAGEIYEWAGDFERALIAYQISLEIEPENGVALEGINRIQD